MLQAPLLSRRTKPDAVCREDHPIKAFGQLVSVAVEHQHIGALIVEAQLQQRLHPARGIQPARLKQLP